MKNALTDETVPEAQRLKQAKAFRDSFFMYLDNLLQHPGSYPDISTLQLCTVRE